MIAGEFVETTPEHPFFTLERGWTPAGELQVNGCDPGGARRSTMTPLVPRCSPSQSVQSAGQTADQIAGHLHAYEQNKCFTLPDVP